uniref:Cysteine and serine rich nuclear protein 1 n=1 Tax=Suricata suricatta TaxID=37032 RepID=A0A673TQC3_SURSU
MTGPLKRKFDQLDEDSSSLCSSSSSLSSSGRRSRSCSPSSSVSLAWDSDEEGPWDQIPLPDRDCCGPQSFTPPSILRRAPRKRPGRVTFDGITVFYFPRCQGFTSVPSRGGCTLGMAPRHNACRRFSLAEFAQEQTRVRREKLRLRLKEERLEAQRWKLTEAGMPETEAGLPLTADAIDDAAVEEDLAAAEAGGRLEEVTFLQCGPEGQPGQASPAPRGPPHALLSLQMDHTAFPCGCCREGCENPEGRVEFNQVRVHTHFIHTLTRLQLEQGAEGPEELPAPGPAGPCEQVPTPTFPLGQPPAGGLGDDSCSSDMTDSSTASGSSEAPGGPTHSALPGPGFQPDVHDDSLARVLSLSDSDLGGEEDEDEDRGVGSLDNLSCFHPADIFGTGDLGGPASWTHSYSTCSLTSGILDENANLDASFFLNSGLAGLGEGSLPGTSGLPSSDAGHSSSVDLSLSSCDSFELLQALPDYSLGPHYSSRKVSDSLDNLDAPYFPLPAFSPPGDASTCFLESIMGLPDSATEVLAPFVDSQLLEDPAPASLVEAVPV